MTVCLDTYGIIGSFIKLSRWYVSQELFITVSDVSELKSPTMRKLPYFEVWISNAFSPRIFRWFAVLFLCEL